jgi:hypothetical protein
MTSTVNVHYKCVGALSVCEKLEISDFSATWGAAKFRAWLLSTAAHKIQPDGDIDKRAGLPSLAFLIRHSRSTEQNCDGHRWLTPQAVGAAGSRVALSG